MSDSILDTIKTARDVEQLRRILTEVNELRPTGHVRRQWLRAAKTRRIELDHVAFLQRETAQPS